VKLNGALVSGGDVTTYQLSADGSRVVYKADQDTDNVVELYSVPIDGSASVKLNGNLVILGDVTHFRLSADGNRVVYVADQDTDAVYELYSVPITGGAAVKLNGALVSGGDVSTPYYYRLSADGSRVVYRADQDVDGVMELYSVPMDGGAVVKLNSELPSNADVESDFRLTPDGRHAVYRADQDTYNVTEIYCVPVTGGAPVKVNGALVSGGDVHEFEISPDDSCIVYRADQDTDGKSELYVWRFQAVWATDGGDWTSASNWTHSVLPDSVREASIARSAVVRVPSGATPTVAASLSLGGASGPSILELDDGATLTLRHGAALYSGGVIRGGGSVAMGSYPLRVPAGAELRAAEGEHLALQSGPVANAGRIEALGTSFSPAEMEFSGAVSNAAGTGAIVGRDAILRFPQGLSNSGSLSFGNGVNEVLGDVSNNPGGLVTVSGGASATFHEDVDNQSVINVSAAGALRSTAVFFGALSGNGTSGSGQVFIEGDARPGFSAGVMAFGGDVSYGPLASLEIELGGADAAQYDRVTVAGQLSLGGTLNVTLLNGYVPAAGTCFNVWDAGSVAGQFGQANMPDLPTGLFWHTDRLDTAGELSVGLTPDTYAGYAAHYGLSTAANGDEDGDGRPNLVEYLTGANPLAPDTGPAGLGLECSSSEAHITFSLAQPVGSDVVLHVQAATSLLGGGNWETLTSRAGNGPWNGDASVTRVGSSAGAERVAVIHGITGKPGHYYRFNVSLAP